VLFLQYKVSESPASRLFQLNAQSCMEIEICVHFLSNALFNCCSGWSWPCVRFSFESFQNQSSLCKSKTMRSSSSMFAFEIDAKERGQSNFSCPFDFFTIQFHYRKPGNKSRSPIAAKHLFKYSKWPRDHIPQPGSSALALQKRKCIAAEHTAQNVERKKGAPSIE